MSHRRVFSHDLKSGRKSNQTTRCLMRAVWWQCFLSKILVSVLIQVGKCKSFEANIRGVASARERGKIDPPLVFQMSLSRCCKTLLILYSPTPPAETKRSELLKTFALLEAGWCCDAPRLTKASASRLLADLNREMKGASIHQTLQPPTPHMQSTLL